MEPWKIAVIIGAAAGIAGGVYQYYKKLKQETKVNSFDVLLEDQLVVDELKVSDIKDWFSKEAEKTKDTNITGVLMKVTDELIEAMGYAYEEKIDVDHYILQMIYHGNIDDFDAGKIGSFRLINYNTISEKLQRAFNDTGMVIITF